MPILLDQKNKEKLTPKFFDSRLTGSGKKVGTINSSLKNEDFFYENEGKVYDPLSINHICVASKRKIKINKNEKATNTLIPLEIPITANERFILKPEKSKGVVLNTTNMGQIEFKIIPKQLGIMETQKIEDGKTRNKIELNVLSDTMIFKKINDSNVYQNQPIFDFEEINNANINMSAYISKNRLVQYLPFEEKEKLEKYISGFSLFDEVTNAALQIKENIKEQIDISLKSIKMLRYDDRKEIIKDILMFLDDYDVDLKNYETINDFIIDNFKPSDAKTIEMTSMNLLMLSKIRKLESIKKKPLFDNSPVDIDLDKFTKNQKKSIVTPSPYTIIQAGAGTGKSTTIMARINYMIKKGIKPEDILVLSFTNAAADNIKNKNPKLKSYTIAKMIHDVYGHNFKHDLSSLVTLINSLEIDLQDRETIANSYNLSNEFIQHLNLLQGVKVDINKAYLSLSEFISMNTDFVINKLNKIKQTTLELEIIIAYILMDRLEIPNELKAQHVIVDETQDNSIFEFVYLLEYVSTYNTSFYIVGDSAQTLYEFRAANPKALSCISRSKAFENHFLDTNFRSNQEILNVANFLLKDIDVNTNNITLSSNNIRNILNHKDTIVIQEYPTPDREFSKNIGKNIIEKSLDYILDKIQKKEKVAILSYANKTISTIEKELRESNALRNVNIENISPKKSYDTSVFSEYIKRYGLDLDYLPPKNIMTTLIQLIWDKVESSNLIRIYSDAQKEHILKYILAYHEKEKKYISDKEKMFRKGVISKEDLSKAIKDSMLNYERMENIKKLNIAKEQDKKLERLNSADIVLSTIHSAKGLEFDNTIVILNDKHLKNQEGLRMYYVALTRAMKTEKIIVQYSSTKPVILDKIDELFE